MFVSKLEITQSPTVSVDQVLTDRNISLLFSGELASCYYDALVSLEERQRLCIFRETCFYKQPFTKIFMQLVGSSFIAGQVLTRRNLRKIEARLDSF
jgi:hypothetical protein